MGLIVILAIFGVIFLVGGIVMDQIDPFSWGDIFSIIGVILLIVALLMGGIAWHDSVYRDTNTEVLRQEYESLLVQLDKNLYNKFTYDGREKLINKVVEYNAKITRGRAKQYSKWIGAFYREDYNSLPLINLNRIKPS